MTIRLTDTLNSLANSEAAASLKHLQCGIEKEGLRVTQKGRIAHSAHPAALGSALTHNSITTDYSEALLEFITSVHASPDAAIAHLEQLHQYSAQVLSQQNELLWPSSMPCYIAGEDDIPIAYYGDSNTGKLKYIYREGLAWRYGKIMQCIAGIHYNFSPVPHFWQTYQSHLGDKGSLKDFRSQQYFGLIRNFRRHAWLLVYLFGASPALDASFIGNRKLDLTNVGLQEGPSGSLIGPYATSLRMSDLGYSNKAQAVLNVCFNDLNTYADSLTNAISTPLQQYQAIGVKVDGHYRQLNANLLQIENEYYSEIRPKRVTRAGQKPVHALVADGVEYVEVRNLDINPFLPAGIDAQQAHFVNLFLVWCLLKDSPIISEEECCWNNENMRQVVRYGRRPGLELRHSNGYTNMALWGHNVLQELQQVAELMPNPDACKHTIATMTKRINDSRLTPSAQVLEAMREDDLSHQELTLQLAKQNQKTYVSTNPQLLQQMQDAAKQSITAQLQLEKEQTGDFDEFLQAYLNQ